MTIPAGIDRIVILDFGSQTTHLIGRRIRERGVLADIRPGDAPVETWYDESVRGIILSGSPASVYDEGSPRFDPEIWSVALPVLGICFGLQVTVHTAGGVVGRSAIREYGPASVRVAEGHPLFAGLSDEFLTWMSHGDSIERLPEGARTVATSAHGIPAAVAIDERRFVGLQFHPEVTHTQHGAQLLDRFATVVCGAARAWNIDDYLERLKDEIIERVGERNVLLLISGGVDSTVVAATLLAALPPHQVHLMYIDTGLMRANESHEVGETLRRLGAEHLHLVDARDRFLSALSGVIEPEEKRRIIGDLFMHVQNDAVAELIPPDYLLAQGTLYTDLIESGFGVGGRAHRIKSHHNVSTPIVQGRREAGELLEPLSALYKDEVRDLGRTLGLPASVVDRHPFPGPGLAVRIVGEVTPELTEILRRADALFVGGLKDAGLYDDIWQAFAVLLPVRSVGVAGDMRAYGHVLALRAVTSVDGMTADAFEFPPGFLRSMAATITNRVPEIGRVVYDLSGKPPATIEWE